jgi:hypothetical protein
VTLHAIGNRIRRDLALVKNASKAWTTSARLQDQLELPRPEEILRFLEEEMKDGGEDN